MSYLQSNGVPYHVGGHDHMHNRAIVTSLNGLSKVQNMIAASDSYKLYILPSIATIAIQTCRSPKPRLPRGSPMSATTSTQSMAQKLATITTPCLRLQWRLHQTYDVIPYDAVSFTKRETYGKNR